MRNIRFSFEDSLVTEKEVLKTAEKLIPEIERMNHVRFGGYGDDRASINLPDDKVMLSKVEQVVEDKLKLEPDLIVVVGIGGSNLGTVAVQEAIQGCFREELDSSIKVLYADTVDSDYMNDIVGIIDRVLADGGTLILNVVSKSGTTAETIANFEVILNLIREEYGKDYERYVVVTSDRESKFWNLARTNGFSVLEIPEKVGGRFSVLSPVGLFPLGLMGVDIQRLLAGARVSRDMCIEKDIKNNPAALCAAVQYLHYNEGKKIFDLFLFSKDLESIGKWYRQLVAESLGKELNIKGERIHSGITPTISIGSTDLHSMAQLYLGGPYDKLTTFVSLEREKTSIKVPKLDGYSDLVPEIQGRNLKAIMDAILEGTKRAFKGKERPFIEIVLPDKSEYSIGQLLQLKMIETMYLGYLLKVNPFNQPNVESYKRETKRILSEEHQIV